MKPVQARNVHEGVIHGVERARLRRDDVRDFDIGQFSIRNLNKRGDRTAQVQPGVHLDRGFGCAEACPREHRETEVDGGGVQGVHGVVEIDASGSPAYIGLAMWMSTCAKSA